MFSLNRTLPSVIPFASRVGFGRTPKPLIQLWRTPLTRDFFSSPYVLAMKRSKPAPSAVSEVLIFKNEEIRASKMRVVYKDATTGEGKWEILTKSQALELAKKMDLDLVLVNDKTDPPVCKLEKYSSIVLAAKKKEKLARTNSKSGVMREIDMIVGIEPRDFEMKMNKVKDFLTNGNDWNYSFKANDQIEKLLVEIDEKLSILNHYRNDPSLQNLHSVIKDKISVSWNYHSNAIEGNTFSLQDTGFFLEYGVTIGGKSLKEHLEIVNHNEALSVLQNFVQSSQEVSPFFLRSLNALILKGIDDNSGNYKTLPNYIKTLDNDIFEFVHPQFVQEELDYLCYWINNLSKEFHPVIASSLAHFNFVRIHPFTDGNGRMARLLMNLMLIRQGFLPIVIHVEKRNNYLRALALTNKGDLNPFISFIIQEIIANLDEINAVYKKHSHY